jgi:hypothetical protein
MKRKPKHILLTKLKEKNKRGRLGGDTFTRQDIQRIMQVSYGASQEMLRTWLTRGWVVYVGRVSRTRVDGVVYHSPVYRFTKKGQKALEKGECQDVDCQFA